MIEINEKFTVAASPDEVYAVLSDPHAVVECVAGASLGEQHEDGSFDGMMTVKFSALRVAFKGKVKLDLDEEARRGVVQASGKDGQGGTKFKATASFDIGPLDGGKAAEVTAAGEVELSGKLASVIENAATAVVRRMTGEFVTALSVRCASGDAQLGSAERVSSTAEAEPTAPAAGVLLLHGFGASPSSLRPWGEALAAAGMSVSIPRLPGHGTRWQDLNRTTEDDWLRAAGEALTALHADHPRVYVMGISLGGTLAVRLAERHPGTIAGVVAVNAPVVGLPGTSGVLRLFRRSVPAVTDTVRKAGVVDVAYQRVPLRAAAALRRLGAATLAAVSGLRVPVLVVNSRDDQVVPPAQSETLWQALPADRRDRFVAADSYHVVPLDNDAQALFGRSIEFVRTHDLVKS
ncbi:MAG TPA: alpha/beta fold hydrolase [Pseudonocardiaceae bacterium]|jgi:carboxylesterase|nr:alpha/beta fold hydrolase [Pseudonocardiaceae bacterium]